MRSGRGKPVIKESSTLSQMGDRIAAILFIENEKISVPLFFPNPRDGTRDNQSETRQQHGIDSAKPREITRNKHGNPDANHRNPHQPMKKSLRSVHLQNFRFFLPITFVFSTQKFIFYSKKARFFSRKPSKTAKKTDFRCKIKKKIWSVEKNVVILHRFFKNHIIN